MEGIKHGVKSHKKDAIPCRAEFRVNCGYLENHYRYLYQKLDNEYHMLYCIPSELVTDFKYYMANTIIDGCNSMVKILGHSDDKIILSVYIHMVSQGIVKAPDPVKFKYLNLLFGETNQARYGRICAPTIQWDVDTLTIETIATNSEINRTLKMFSAHFGRSKFGANSSVDRKRKQEAKKKKHTAKNGGNVLLNPVASDMSPQAMMDFCMTDILASLPNQVISDIDIENLKSMKFTPITKTIGKHLTINTSRKDWKDRFNLYFPSKRESIEILRNVQGFKKLEYLDIFYIWWIKQSEYSRNLFWEIFASFEILPNSTTDKLIKWRNGRLMFCVRKGFTAVEEPNGKWVLNSNKGKFSF
jgi:hypothetical protein